MQLDQGLAALLGALVGGAASLAGTWLTGWQAQRQASDADTDKTRAAAILLQDDFYHYQATLARALDNCQWWDASRLLPDEATIKDVKRVYAGLSSASTDRVAGALGWTRVLMQRQRFTSAGNQLSQADYQLIKDTFTKLGDGRSELATLAGRPYTAFEEGHIMQDLQHKTLPELLNHCGAQAAAPHPGAG